MPKLTQKKPLDEGLTIGVSKASRTTKAPHWYAYIYFPALSEQEKPTSLYKSLKLKYIEGSTANEREAIDRAYRLFNPIRKRYLEGNNNFLQKITIGYVIADFCKEAKELTDANENLIANGNEPVNEVAIKDPVMECDPVKCSKFPSNSAIVNAEPFTDL